MGSLLNLIGSFFLSGLIILQILGYHFILSGHLSEMTASLCQFEQFQVAAQSMEHDLTRCGLMVLPPARFVTMSPDRCAFRFGADENNDGYSDSETVVEYYLADHPDPAWRRMGVRQLMRKSDDDAPRALMSRARALSFEYFDQNSQPTGDSEMVRTIRLSVEVWSPVSHAANETNRMTYIKQLHPLNLF